MNELARRWRLVLGRDSLAENDSPLSSLDKERDTCLDYLYGREHASPHGPRGSGDGPSTLTPVRWLENTRRAFPASTATFLQQQAIDRYQLKSLLTDPQVLASTPPNMALVETLLNFRHVLPAEVMSQVRHIISAVCRDLERRLETKILSQFSSRRLRHQHGGRQQFSNLDWQHTIKRNLKHYDLDTDTLVLAERYFNRRQANLIPWEVYILVDQSGSMASSVIHSAVMASIFFRIRALKTHLILFDTQVVDITADIQDPVETLLAVQLGGGTDIANALHYAAEKICQPQRSLVVLISDFFEGGDIQALLDLTSQLRQNQVSMLGIAALDPDAAPDFDHYTAQKLADRGMPVGAMTPDQLTAWIVQHIGQ